MKFKEFSEKTDTTQKWIKKHLDLIDDNKWNEVYEYLTRTLYLP